MSGGARWCEPRSLTKQCPAAGSGQSSIWADRPNHVGVGFHLCLHLARLLVREAFVIEYFAGALSAGRRSMRPDFVLDALEQALYTDKTELSDALVQSPVTEDRRMFPSATPSAGRSRHGHHSVGSRGDSYDNALAETHLRCMNLSAACCLENDGGCWNWGDTRMGLLVQMTTACSNPSAIYRRS